MGLIFLEVVIIAKNLDDDADASKIMKLINKLTCTGSVAPPGNKISTPDQEVIKLSYKFLIIYTS